MLDNSPLLASAVMTRDVVTVTPDDTLRAAVKLMAKHGISGLVVVDEAGGPIGMLTEGDLIRWHEGLTERQTAWLERLGEGYEVSSTYVETLRDANHRVRAVMTRHIVTVPETAPAREIAMLMHGNGVKRVPVVRDGKLVGIVSRADLVRALAEALDAPPILAAPEQHTIDEALRHAREEALKKVPRVH